MCCEAEECTGVGRSARSFECRFTINSSLVLMVYTENLAEILFHCSNLDCGVVPLAGNDVP